jgi:hypothetical protein
MLDHMHTLEDVKKPGFPYRESVNALVGGTLDMIFIKNGLGSNDHRGITGGVCICMSRVNHACAPSAQTFYDYETNTFILHATRTIKTGEEITISYTEFGDPTMGGIRSTLEGHRAYLEQQYGIFCSDGYSNCSDGYGNCSDGYSDGKVPCICTTDAFLEPFNKCNTLEAELIDRLRDGQVNTPVVTDLIGQWLRAHDIMSVRARYMVRVRIQQFMKQLNVNIVGLNLHIYATKLTFPDSDLVRSHIRND